MVKKNPQFSLDRLIRRAEREAGAYGLIDEALRGRIAAMLGWINEKGPYAAHQLEPITRQLLRLLVNRLRLAQDRLTYPAIAAEVIDRPIFIVGLPRSGTTLLHALLAEDPKAHALQSWHVFEPSPPPGAMPVCPERIASAQRLVEDWMDFCPAQKPMHPYIDKGAYQLIEDEEVFTYDFRNVYTYELYRIPSLEEFKPQAEPRAAFAFHRDVLQHLQWNTGKTRWVCKGPSAQHHLDALLDIYPDALCVWAHRPLSEIYASIATLSGVIYDTIRGEPRDWSINARARAEGMKAAIDRLMQNAMIDDPRILHIPFHDLSADPVGTIRKIYDRRGVAFEQAFESRLRDWLAAPENRVDRYGRYNYSYEPFGFDKAWIRDLFADYSKRFGLKDAA